MGTSSLASFKACLTTDSGMLPVEAMCSSKYSLLVRFENDDDFPEKTEFPDLQIFVNGQFVKLGPCRFIPGKSDSVDWTRVVCKDEFYDFEKLFSQQKLTKLQNRFASLPVTLAYKHKVSKEFKHYTSDLTYDLSVYRRLFDELDAECKDEPKDVKKSIQRAVINSEGRRLTKYFDEQLDELQRQVKQLPSEDHKRHGFFFRRQLWNYIIAIPLMARGNLKPRGYSGDSKMMSMIYADDYLGRSTFAKILHKHATEHPGSQAVRNRRTLIAETLRRLGAECRNGNVGKLDVLSVASGPAVEVRDIMASPEDCSALSFSLLDQDEVALREAASNIAQVESRWKTGIEVNYLHHSVRTMLVDPQFIGKCGTFDFIYSMGLFDYLTPRVARAVLSKLFMLLKPGGEIVVGNFHASNPSRYYMEYWVDWVLYYRNEEEFIGLVDDGINAEKEVFFEETGCQMFLHLKKPA